MAMLELHPAEVVSVAEARAAAIVGIFPEQAPAGKPIEPAEYLAAINGLLGSLRYFVLENARLADELDYIRRRIERLEQGKGI